MNSKTPYLIRLSTDSDVSTVRQLVNLAYKELADMGLNYTATYQDENKTRERMSKGRCYLLLDGERVIGTILLREKDHFNRTKRCAYLAQFAIHPDFKRQKLGSLLMDHVEKIAAEEGYESIQLDTAKQAPHLVAWYLKRGYQIVDEHKYEGKTYESLIFEKDLRS